MTVLLKNLLRLIRKADVGGEIASGNSLLVASRSSLEKKEVRKSYSVKSIAVNLKVFLASD